MSASPTSSINSDVGRKKWMKKIKKMLEDEGTQICIHKVPQRLRAMKPEAYTPQCIGLGPYHHWCEDLYMMEQYKLIASKKLLKDCHNHEEAIPKLTVLANSLKKVQICRIHASYDCFLGMDDKAIAWMMMIDALFLLQFLQAFTQPNESNSLSLEKTAYYFMDPRKPTYHLILQDIIKLENQIPTIVLKHLLSSSSCNISLEQDILPSMLHEFCKKLNPFKYNLNITRDNKEQHTHHLLELLYHLIVPDQLPNSNNSSTQQSYVDGSTPENNAHHHKLPISSSDIAIQTPDCGMLRRMLNIPCLRHLTHNKLLRFFDKVISNPVTSMITGPIKNLCQPQSTTSPELGGGSSSSTSSPEGNNNNKEAPKVLDEIDIPSVSDLIRIGVKFYPLHHNCPITSIQFCKKTGQFHLPVITIDANTEVVIRNLVAYEAVGVPGPSVLARYTELMKGIIDTTEDVKHLKERKIIHSKSKSDEDVAQLWNGMSRSIKLLSNNGRMDNAISDAKAYFDNKKRVKIVKFTKECMLCGWKISMLLLTFLLVVLMVIQSFCDVYNCPQAVRSVAAPEP